MAKITREESSSLQKQAGQNTDLVEYSLRQLPRTPGRDAALKGVEQVKEGLAQIIHESEGDRG